MRWRGQGWQTRRPGASEEVTIARKILRRCSLCGNFHASYLVSAHLGGRGYYWRACWKQHIRRYRMSVESTRETMTAYLRALGERGPLARYFANDVTFTVMGGGQQIQGSGAVEEF